MNKMKTRKSKSGTTGSEPACWRSKGVVHIISNEKSQTSVVGTPERMYGLDSSTTPQSEEEPWSGLANAFPTIEVRTDKNAAETSGVIGHEEQTYTTSNSLRPAPHDPVNCSKSVTSGMLIPPCLQLDPSEYILLDSASHHPPVTVSTLGELNLNWMMHYVNLRCDINFDHDLHFTPIKGCRGEEKRKAAVEYWLALAAEFRIYRHGQMFCQSCHTSDPVRLTFTPRLPTMFHDLRELLESLVPDRDHDQVAEHLDIGLLVQEVSNGVLDIGKLSRWLAILLKCHCAPMRDDSAESMAEQIEVGANTGDLSMLINGLESLFGFLEAMKLDVANHQIRTFRYLLIEETIPFQQSYFRKRIDDNRLDVRASRAWFEDMLLEHSVICGPHPQQEKQAYLESFLHGLVGLCAHDQNGHCPPPPLTLQYDRGRIQQLGEDLADIISLQICVDVFTELVQRLGGLHSIPESVYSTLRWRVLTIADNGPLCEGTVLWADSVEAIAVEITRAAFAVCRGPGCIIPDDEISNTASHLWMMFVDTYHTRQELFLSQLEQETIRQSAVFQKLTTLAMSESQKQYHQTRQQKGDLENLPDLENMARMLAHMGVLHWQVWAELVYLKEGDKLDSIAQDCSEEPVSIETFGQSEGEEESADTTDECEKLAIEHRA